MFDLHAGTDYALVLLRVMAGAIVGSSGYGDLKSPDERSKSIEMSKPFTLFLGVAELAGAAGIVLGILTQLAAIGLILILLGAIQKKLVVWKTGFWGKDGMGWNYDLTIISMLLVIVFTDGGRFILLPS
jgi:putative oxidoreductase